MRNIFSPGAWLGSAPKPTPEQRAAMAATIRSVVRTSLAAAERDDGERRRIALAGAAELSRLAGR